MDGLEFKGSGAVGPPYSQEDFDRLAALGVNYVSISGPGLFAEAPPFEVDIYSAQVLNREVTRFNNRNGQ